jgi:zinc-binding in reverse transcriptase
MVFSVWLEFDGVQTSRYDQTWSSPLPLKFKVFLWLVQQNKILTKENLLKKGWQDSDQYTFFLE